MKGKQLGLFEAARKGSEVARFEAAPSSEDKVRAAAAGLTPEAERLLANFQVVTSAPDGISVLRGLILDLAVRGRLVLGGRNDGTTPLIDRVVDDSCLPFELPATWSWVTVGDLGPTQTGTTPTAARGSSGEVPFIRPGDISAAGAVRYDGERLAEDVLREHGRLAPANTVLMVCIGTVGKCGWIDRACSFNQQINAVTPQEGALAPLVWHFMRSPWFQAEALARSSETTITILNKGRWASMPFPLPPLRDQEATIAKLDELMKLCDDLEARQAKQRETAGRLNEAALDALTSAEGPEELAASWRRVAGSFDALTAGAEAVQALRKTILGLATTGKLLRQDPNDEPASALFARIARADHSTDQGLREAGLGAHRLPESWMWLPLGAFLVLKSGTTLDPSIERATGDIPYLKVSDMNLPGNERDAATSSRFVDESEAVARYVIEPNSIIFPKRGGAIATNKKRCVRRPVLVDLNIMAITCPPEICFEYIFYWFARIDLAELDNGTSVPQINHKDLVRLLVPLPPLAEQNRIVAKVDHLMKLCDALEAALRRAEDTSRKLADALVAELLA